MKTNDRNEILTDDPDTPLEHWRKKTLMPLLIVKAKIRLDIDIQGRAVPKVSELELFNYSSNLQRPQPTRQLKK